MKFIPNGTGKFRFWCQKVLPLVYDDSLSYYEVLCKLRDFVNQLAERIADAFDEINTNVREYVYQWLDDHPEATTTVEDGGITEQKLADNAVTNVKIANGSVSYEKLDDNMQLSVKQMLLNAVLDINSYLPFVSIKDDSGYTSSQGIVTVDDYLIVTRFINDASPVQYYVIDLNTKTVVGTYSYTNNHNNSLTYANGNIYSIYGDKAYIIPFTNGVMGTQYAQQLPMQFVGATYDEVEEKFYLLSSDEKSIYSSVDLAIFNFEFEIIASNVAQGMCADDNFLYFAMSGDENVERIYVTDKEGTYIHTYEFPRLTYGEIQDVSTLNGDMFINFQRVTSGNNVYCLPLYKNSSVKPYNAECDIKNYSFRKGNQIHLYLDPSNVVSFGNGSETKPFNTLANALQYIETFGDNNILEISGTYAELNISDINKSLTINFNNATIQQLHFFRCNRVNLTGRVYTKNMSVTGCTVYIMAGVYFTGGNTTDDIALVVYRGIVTGYVATANTYRGFVRALQSIVNLAHDGLTNVSTPNYASNSSIVYLNGTAV